MFLLDEKMNNYVYLPKLTMRWFTFSIDIYLDGPTACLYIVYV